LERSSISVLSASSDFVMNVVMGCLPSFASRDHRGLPCRKTRAARIDEAHPQGRNNEKEPARACAAKVEPMQGEGWKDEMYADAKETRRTSVSTPAGRYAHRTQASEPPQRRCGDSDAHAILDVEKWGRAGLEIRRNVQKALHSSCTGKNGLFFANSIKWLVFSSYPTGMLTKNDHGHDR